jgi:hypothetical protein
MDWKLFFNEMTKSGIGRKPRRKYRQFPNLEFSGFPGGLNTSVPSDQLDKSECAELVNFSINKDGRPVTRYPIVAHTSSAFTSNASLYDTVYCPIDGTMRELFVDENDVLYYNNSGVPTTIASLEGPTTLLPFNGVCLLLDGDYIKYLDNLTTLKIAYDDGTGPSGHQTYFLDGIISTRVILGTTLIRFANKFTSQSWTAGYTIPPTTATVSLARFGLGWDQAASDDTPIYIKVRKVSDDSVIASKILVDAPIEENVSTSYVEYSATFSTSDIVSDLLPSTDYYLSVEYDNGDASNSIYVPAIFYSDGTSGIGYQYSQSVPAWSTTGGETYIMALRPGRPPKGSFGVAHNHRPFIAGDTDSPGLVWFGNLTYLDWSTADGGGYVGAVDPSSNSYPVGAILSLYNELYVFGQESQPVLCKLTGSSPSSFALPDISQKVWTTQFASVVTPNDLWFASSSMISNLTGVQEFGDIRTSPIADPIIDRLKDYWSTSTALMSYDGNRGELWICMPSYHRVLVCNIGAGTRVGRKLRFPWSEYEFTLDILTSSSYKWTASSVPHLYYLELAAGGDPSVLVPDALLMDGELMTRFTGSWSDHYWSFGDGDLLGYDTVYIRDDSGPPSTTGIEIRNCIIPTALKFSNGKMLLGASNGLVYKVSPSSYEEMGSFPIRYDLRTPYSFPHVDSVIISRIEAKAGGVSASEFSLSLCIDKSSDSTVTLDFDQSTYPDSIILQGWVEVACYGIQFRIHDLVLSGDPVTIHSITGYIEPTEV